MKQKIDLAQKQGLLRWSMKKKDEQNHLFFLLPVLSRHLFIV